MINWNTDEKRLKKLYPEEYKIWRVAQLINYGLEEEKVSRKFLVTHWEQIKKRLDPARRRTIEWLLWNTPWTHQQA